MALNILEKEKYQSLPEDMFVIGEDDSGAEEIVRPSTTYWHDVWVRFRHDPLALIGLVAWSVSTLRKDRRQGKSTCGGSCGCCPMAGSCHKK